MEMKFEGLKSEDQLSPMYKLALFDEFLPFAEKLGACKILLMPCEQFVLRVEHDGSWFNWDEHGVMESSGDDGLISRLSDALYELHSNIGRLRRYHPSTIEQLPPDDPNAVQFGAWRFSFALPPVGKTREEGAMYCLKRIPGRSWFRMAFEEGQPSKLARYRRLWIEQPEVFQKLCEAMAERELHIEYGMLERKFREPLKKVDARPSGIEEAPAPTKKERAPRKPSNKIWKPKREANLDIWLPVVELKCDKDIVWTFFRERNGKSVKWINGKLTALKGALYKCSYPISYNTEERRFAKTKFLGMLEENRPELVAGLMDFMKKSY